AAASVSRPSRTVHYFRDPRSRLEGEEKEEEDRERSMGWQKERQREKMIEWEKNLEKKRREAVRYEKEEKKEIGYVLRFIDGLKFTPNQRLSVYRRWKSDHCPEDTRKTCGKCMEYGCYADAITIAATDLVMTKQPREIRDEPVNEGRIESTDEEEIMEMDSTSPEGEDDPQSSTQLIPPQVNGDAFFILRRLSVSEESNSASDGTPSLEPGFDSGIIPPLKTKENGRRMETEEEAKIRMKYMEKMEENMRMDQEGKAMNVDRISQGVIMALMEKNGETEKAKKEGSDGTSTQSTTRCTPSHLPLSGTEARSDNSSKSTVDQRGGGAASIQPKKVPVNSERLARIRGKNEEMIKRSRGDGEKFSSSLSPPSEGVSLTTTPAAKHLKASSGPSSSRSSDEPRQKSGKPAVSPSRPVAVISPSSSIRQGVPASTPPTPVIPSADNSIRPVSTHSRSSNEDNSRQQGSAASAAAPSQLVAEAMRPAADAVDRRFEETVAVIRQNARAQTGLSTSSTPHPMVTPPAHPSFPYPHSTPMFMHPPHNPQAFPFPPPSFPPPVMQHPFGIYAHQFMPFPSHHHHPMGMPSGVQMANPPPPPPP
ncbi:hypothetical protein PENTCL1PPCAC_26882, partial [Pristionchus entomophagus]